MGIIGTKLKLVVLNVIVGAGGTGADWGTGGAQASKVGSGLAAAAATAAAVALLAGLTG